MVVCLFVLTFAVGLFCLRGE